MTPSALRVPAGPRDWGLVTALPTTPANGDFCTFTDSLTAPTYTWRLQYVSAKSSNKWVFVGGSAKTVYASANDAQTTTGTLQALTNRPKFAAPLAGDYNVRFATYQVNSSDGYGFTTITINGGGYTRLSGNKLLAAVEGNTGSGEEIVTAAAADSIDMMHYITAATVTWKGTPDGRPRYISVTPIAVGG